MDRRGMRAALSTPARNDLRLLWAAAREVRTYQSGVRSSSLLQSANARACCRLVVVQ